MNADTFSHEPHHLTVHSATHPIEPFGGALAALLRLAGMSPLRCRALPSHRRTAHSGVSNRRF
jgi:hypothetical protein